MFRTTLSQCAIILLFACSIYGYTLSQELYEGSPCKTEHDVAGECKKIDDCISRLRDLQNRIRLGNAPGRCGFTKDKEIVCCATDISPKSSETRAADIVCNSYQKDKETEAKMNTYIGGGTVALEGQFPYMAALGFPNTDEIATNPINYDCGGTLISRKYVLTAAHCVRNNENRVPTMVRLGSKDLQNGNAQEIEIANITSHEEYRTSQNYHDIALVLLQKSAEITENVKPICLHTKVPQTSIDSSSWFGAIGFGATDLDRPRSNVLMKTAKLQFVPTATCNDHYADVKSLPNGIGDTFICAVDPNKVRLSDACQGDSGGPLLIVSGEVHTLLAVTSFGQGCGSIVPGVYTSVPFYLNWIEPKVWPDLVKQ